MKSDDQLSPSHSARTSPRDISQLTKHIVLLDKYTNTITQIQNTYNYTNTNTHNYAILIIIIHNNNARLFNMITLRLKINGTPGTFQCLTPQRQVMTWHLQRTPASANLPLRRACQPHNATQHDYHATIMIMERSRSACQPPNATQHDDHHDYHPNIMIMMIMERS